MNLANEFKIVIDVETSGNCPIKNGVIAACVLIIDKNDNVIDQFVRFVCPPDLTRATWSEEAQGIHGITFEQVQTFISNDQFCYELLMFLKPYKREDNFPIPFICHANPHGWYDKLKHEWIIIKWFDYNFLEWAFRKAKFQDGTEMVWSMFKVCSSKNLISTVKMGRDAKYKKNGLKVWAERLGIDLKHHDATSDTYACLATYIFLKANHGQQNNLGNQHQIDF